MKTIGMDVSLDCCKNEGYMMMSYDARKKFNPSTEYHFFSYYPDYCNFKGLRTDTYLSLIELWEMCLSNKKEIDSFTDVNHNSIDEINDFYLLLWFASDISAYQGI